MRTLADILTEHQANSEEGKNLSEYHAMETGEHTDYDFHPQVQTEEDPRDCITLHFLELAHITKEGNHRAGAILLSLANVETEETVEKWIPKALCKNLDTTNNTVAIYNGTGFADKELEEYME